MTPAVPTNDAARAMDALRRIVRSLHAANARAEQSTGLTAAQLFVLRQIAAEPDLSMTRLAERTRSAQSSVSEVVSRLVAGGHVARRKSREDARRVALTLSEAGHRVADRAGETVQERLVAALEKLPPPQRSSLANLMEAWIAAAELGDEPAEFFLSAENEAVR